MALLTYKEALNQALDEELSNNEDIVLIGEDIGSYGGTYGVEDGLLEKYGAEKLLNTPMSKSSVMGMAVGAAMTGLRPVLEVSSSDFITLGLDNLINQAAKTSYLTLGKTSVPLTVRVPTGIFKDSSINQTQNLESLLINYPGLKIVSPTSPQQAKDLLKDAINDENPVVFLEDKNLYDTEGEVMAEKEYSLGKSVIEKEGSDLTIVSWGSALNKVKEISEVLEKEGIYPEIINPLTLSPLDMEPIIDSIIKTSRLIIVHDGNKYGGIGSEIAAEVIESDAFNYLDNPIIRVAGENTPIPFNRKLKDSVVLNDKDILEAVYTVLE